MRRLQTDFSNSLSQFTAVLAVDVAVVDAADGDDAAGFVAAVVADELGHRPGLERRAVRAQAREVAEQDLYQLVLGLPEAGE